MLLLTLASLNIKKSLPIVLELLFLLVFCISITIVLIVPVYLISLPQLILILKF